MIIFPIMIFESFDLFFIYLTFRVTEKESLFTGPLPRWPQWPELCRTGARSFFRVSYMDAGAQTLGPSFAVFPSISKTVLKVKKNE